MTDVPFAAFSGDATAALHESAPGTKPRCAAVQQVVGYWKCCGPSASLGGSKTADKRGIVPSLLHGNDPYGRVT
jgi:hypothetical protein